MPLSPIYLDKQNDDANADGKVIYRPKDKLSAFAWYGGKCSHLGWLLPLLPECRHYCEPFSGSAAVLLNRDPSPVETYNDIDGDVVNFFRVLRDSKDELIEKIALTPFSREEFYYSLKKNRPKNIGPLERARLFFVRARQVRIGFAQRASLGQWANCRSVDVSVARWIASPDSLAAVADRLLGVQIENRPSLEVIRAYDSLDTLFYCDPPYPHESRSEHDLVYMQEMTNDDHREMAEVLHKSKGLVAVSGYRCPLMEEVYGDWICIDVPDRVAHSSAGLVRTYRSEALWMNPKLANFKRAGRLFLKFLENTA
jgi:DNA adenine methylase